MLADMLDICMFICIYVLTYICRNASIYLWKQICMNVYVCVYTFMYIHIST